MKTVIGLDFGTQSARAVLADAETGEILLRQAAAYPHGILPGDLALAEDYLAALAELLRAMTPPDYRETLAGICVAATSLTLTPADGQGRALDMSPAFRDHPHARIKLWKRHAAQPQAEEALQLARETDQPFLGRTGGSLSCEWMLPKLMEIYDEAPEVFAAMDCALDLCDFLTCALTGEIVRSRNSMCFKTLWAEDLGFPGQAYLDTLRPGLGEKYRRLLRGGIMLPGGCAGMLRPEFRAMLGLRQDVAVAVGMMDGHTTAAALGALEMGEAALVIGTSNVLTLHMDSLREIKGVCGVAKDTIVPGLCSVDAGQACTGDMLAWYMEQMLPASVWLEAEKRRMSPHDLLGERIQKPWQDALLAVDWFNGSRNAPCDLTLPGGILGLTMASRPEDIYLALLQSIVCGTGEILDACRADGVSIRRIRAAGGIAAKNPLLMQLYADILDMEVLTAQTEEGPALGAALYAAVGAGLYPTIAAAYGRMGVKHFKTYRPSVAHRGEYGALYQKNRRFRRMLIDYRQEEAARAPGPADNA